MNIENRATKLYLKELPPLTVYDLLDKYRIPTPFKEILIAVCILKLKDFPALDYLQEKYYIHLSYRTYVRRLKDALEMFRKSHTGKI